MILRYQTHFPHTVKKTVKMSRMSIPHISSSIQGNGGTFRTKLGMIQFNNRMSLMFMEIFNRQWNNNDGSFYPKMNTNQNIYLKM